MTREHETELARALLAGDANAFEQFVANFSAKVFRYSLTMCGQRQDAEEVAQETLFKVFESFATLRDPSHVRAWVFRIAKNVCLMKRRKSVFAPEHELSLDSLMPVSGHDGEHRHIEIADWSQIPEDQALRGELRTALEQAISELPEIYRQVVLLRDMEELSTDETALVLDIAPDTVKTRLHRGRLAMRQKLDQFLSRREAVKA